MASPGSLGLGELEGSARADVHGLARTGDLVGGGRFGSEHEHDAVVVLVECVGVDEDALAGADAGGRFAVILVSGMLTTPPGGCRRRSSVRAP